MYAFEAAFPAQHNLSRSLAHLAPGHIQWDSKRTSLLLHIRKPRSVLGPVPRIDRTLIQAQTFVRDHKAQIVVHRIPKPLASRASTKGIVEAEQPWLRLLAGTMA